MDIENKIKNCETQILQLKNLIKEYKKLLPKKKIERNYLYYEAVIKYCSRFSYTYDIVVPEELKNKIGYASNITLSTAKHSWNNSNRPKIGQTVLCRTHLPKNGFKKTTIVDVL